nr:uncharacterized protein LOC111506019 [Leptinotarsa decemlineata]
MATLSRYFNENVELVANMYPRCYEECHDVRIVSVSEVFLEQVHKRTSRSFNIPHWLLVIDHNNLEETNFLGFSRNEVLISETYADTMQKIIDDMQKGLRNFKISHCSKEEECFNGFPSRDVKRAQLYRQKVKRTWYIMSYKIFKRISLSVIKNINRRRFSKETKKNKSPVVPASSSNECIINRQKGSLITKEDHKITEKLSLKKSKYFNHHRFLNNNIEFSVDRGYRASRTEQGHNNIVECRLKAENSICKSEIEEEIFLDVPLHLEFKKNVQPKFGPVDYEYEYFRILDHESEHISEFRSKFRLHHLWIPPRSPHNLIEERLYHDPWALLTATIFLNRTSCTVARPFVFWFLTENPGPLKVLDQFPKDLEKYFCDLGLHSTRAVQVYRMSYDFLFKNWKNASELYGIGNYGENAFRMFCLGDFSVEPKDRFLKIYKAWYLKLYLKSEPS